MQLTSKGSLNILLVVTARLDFTNEGTPLPQEKGGPCREADHMHMYMCMLADMAHEASRYGE